jgi:GntR family transcriptional regulator, rspAB operon transcriptional repressor
MVLPSAIRCRHGWRTSACPLFVENQEENIMPQIRRRRTLTDDIYDRLRSMIIALELGPGETLNEKELCARFGVSRTPVREAMLRLSEQGLVMIAPQHGTFVSGIDPEAVRQAQFLRENLEVPVALRLCEAEGNLDLSDLQAVILEQHVVLGQDDFATLLPLDDRFHQGLFELAGVGDLWSVIQAKKAHLDRVRFLQAPHGGKLARIVGEHEAILRAIARHDREETERVVRLHLSGSVSFLDELLAERPELFAAPDRLAHRTVAPSGA